MLRIRVLACLLSLLALAGCLDGGVESDDPAGDDPAGQPGNPDAPGQGQEARRSLAVRALAVGDASGHTERTREVMADAAAWDAFWAKHAAGDPRAGDKPEPAVDFSEERVVAVVFGAVPPGCGWVRVTDAPSGAAGGDVRVEVTAFDPPPAEVACGGVVRQPYPFVAIPLAGGPVRFEEREAAGSPPS